MKKLSGHLLMKVPLSFDVHCSLEQALFSGFNKDSKRKSSSTSDPDFHSMHLHCCPRWGPVPAIRRGDILHNTANQDTSLPGDGIENTLPHCTSNDIAWNISRQRASLVVAADALMTLRSEDHNDEKSSTEDIPSMKPPRRTSKISLLSNATHKSIEDQNATKKSEVQTPPSSVITSDASSNEDGGNEETIDTVDPRYIQMRTEDGSPISPPRTHYDSSTLLTQADFAELSRLMKSTWLKRLKYCIRTSGQSLKIRDIYNRLAHYWPCFKEHADTVLLGHRFQQPVRSAIKKQTLYKATRNGGLVTNHGIHNGAYEIVAV